MAPASTGRKLDPLAFLALPGLIFMALVFLAPLLLMLWSSIRGADGFTLAGYARVLGAQDAGSFARGLQQAGYATDPAYADKLERIIKGPLLRAALSG